MISEYDYFEVSSDWRRVSPDWMVRKIISKLPGLDAALVRSVLIRDSFDGVYFSFELMDWVTYFKDGMYV